MTFLERDQYSIQAVMDAIQATSDEDDHQYELEAQQDREIAFAPVCPPLSLGVQHAAPPACSSPATPGRLATGRPGATGSQRTWGLL